MSGAQESTTNAVADHAYVGIADEARKAIGCDEPWAEGDCFANLPEMNDYDPCARCHLAWRIAGFEDEATDWWRELGAIDISAERGDAHDLGYETGVADGREQVESILRGPQPPQDPMPKPDETTSPGPQFDEAASAVDAWNASHPKGAPVRYWPGIREGEGVASTTRSAAMVLGGHTAVVWVEGRGDCIALTHVEGATA